ncbi:hypothetical protein ACR2WG_26605, partial [Klebsiella pneumoniae]
WTPFSFQTAPDIYGLGNALSYLIFDPSFGIFILFCREPRGFGFIQYIDPSDAAEAKYHMDGQILLGRRLTVVFAEENRKKPDILCFNLVST